MTDRTIELDISGQICPSCLLLALKAINDNAPELRAGRLEILVTTDDRQATTTIPVTAGRMGFATEIERIEPAYRIRIFTAT